MAGEPTSLRLRLHEILDRQDPTDPVANWFVRLMTALIIVNVAAAVMLTDERFSDLHPLPFRVIEIVSVIAFGIEYALRLWSCVESPMYRGLSAWQARARWVVTPAAIIDFIALVPFVLVHIGDTDMRTLAILRLLRFFKLARYSPGLASLLEAVRAERRGLLACFVVICAGVLIAASAIYFAENAAQPDKFGSIPQSMWWAVETITTVGYGDVIPVTVLGQIIGGFTMMTGIFMLALPVGIVATAFMEVIRRREFVVTWGMIARIPLFADLDSRAMAQVVPHLRARNAEAGELVVPRGSAPRAIFFIVSGMVEIEPREGEALRLGAGHYFGEATEPSERHRGILVRAVQRTRMLVLSGDDIDELVGSRPELASKIAAVSTYGLAPAAVVS